MKNKKKNRAYQGALTIAPANIIDNYFERQEREAERKGIVNVCVCGLLIIQTSTSRCNWSYKWCFIFRTRWWDARYEYSVL